MVSCHSDVWHCILVLEVRKKSNKTYVSTNKYYELTENPMSTVGRNPL